MVSCVVLEVFIVFWLVLIFSVFSFILLLILLILSSIVCIVRLVLLVMCSCLLWNDLIFRLSGRWILVIFGIIGFVNRFFSVLLSGFLFGWGFLILGLIIFFCVMLVIFGSVISNFWSCVGFRVRFFFCYVSLEVKFSIEMVVLLILILMLFNVMCDSVMG